MDVVQPMDSLSPSHQHQLEQLKIIFNELSEEIIIKCFKQAKFDVELAADLLTSFCQNQEHASNFSVVSSPVQNSEIQVPSERKSNRRLKSKAKSLNENGLGGWHAFTQKYHEERKDRRTELQYRYQNSATSVLSAENFPSLNTASDSSCETANKQKSPSVPLSSPVTFLCEIFPMHSREFLKDILKAANNHMEKAVILILNFDENENVNVKDNDNERDDDDDEVTLKVTDSCQSQSVSRNISPHKCDEVKGDVNCASDKTAITLLNAPENSRHKSPAMTLPSLSLVATLPSTAAPDFGIETPPATPSSTRNDYDSCYYDFRKEAIKSFRLRNQLYRRASRQYECGNHTEARRLANEVYPKNMPVLFALSYFSIV
jgi:hypothetical protein